MCFLYVALSVGDMDMVSLLLELMPNFDVNARIECECGIQRKSIPGCKQDGCQLNLNFLHEAILAKNGELVKKLLAFPGIDTNAKNGLECW